MFHLFGKVYIDIDIMVDPDKDRVLCTEAYAEYVGSGKGRLLATAKTVEQLLEKNSFLDILQLVNSVGSNVHIYCDRPAYYEFVSRWFKILIPNCNKEQAWKFLKSHIFKEKNFLKIPHTTHNMLFKQSDIWLMEQTRFEHIWDKVDVGDPSQYTDFLRSVSNSLRVEFLLASYLYDNRLGEQLAHAISPLVRKDLEKFLYEHKEIILVHFQRPIFQKLLGVKNGPYTFDNFYDMMDDPSPYCELMFRDSIWGDTRTTMYAPSSRSSINLSGFEEEDIDRLKEYSIITGQVWSDELWYTQSRLNSTFMPVDFEDYKQRYDFVINSRTEESKYNQTYLRSEIDKFDFIKFFKNKQYLTVDELNKIIEYEIYNQYHAAGSFYSIDLVTVNNYFVDYVLFNHTDKQLLKPYVIENL